MYEQSILISGKKFQLVQVHSLDKRTLQCPKLLTCTVLTMGRIASNIRDKECRLFKVNTWTCWPTLRGQCSFYVCCEAFLCLMLLSVLLFWGLHFFKRISLLIVKISEQSKMLNYTQVLGCGEARMHRAARTAGCLNKSLNGFNSVMSDISESCQILA